MIILNTNYKVPHCGAFSTPHSNPSWAQIFASGSCFQIPLACIFSLYHISQLFFAFSPVFLLSRKNYSFKCWVFLNCSFTIFVHFLQCLYYYNLILQVKTNIDILLYNKLSTEIKQMTEGPLKNKLKLHRDRQALIMMHMLPKSFCWKLK